MGSKQYAGSVDDVDIKSKQNTLNRVALSPRSHVIQLHRSGRPLIIYNSISMLSMPSQLRADMICHPYHGDCYLWQIPMKLRRSRMSGENLICGQMCKL